MGREQELIETLVRLCQHSNPFVTRNAAAALGNLGYEYVGGWLSFV